jgi:hypothetical protein
MFASRNTTSFKFVAVPLTWFDQFAPPSVVARILPDSPTTRSPGALARFEQVVKEIHALLRPGRYEQNLTSNDLVREQFQFGVASADPVDLAPDAIVQTAPGRELFQTIPDAESVPRLAVYTEGSGVSLLTAGPDPDASAFILKVAGRVARQRGTVADIEEESGDPESARQLLTVMVQRGWLEVIRDSGPRAPTAAERPL